MYFDPDWIFNNKQDKQQYPNITGLMLEDEWPPSKPNPAVKPVSEMADVFIKPQPVTNTPTPEDKNTIMDRVEYYVNPMNFIKKRIADNISPFSYRDPYWRAFSAIFRKEKGREEAEELRIPAYQSRMDFLNVYAGKPQHNNTLSPSEFRPSLSSDPNAKYYRINPNDELVKYLLETISHNPETGDQFKVHPGLPRKRGTGVVNENPYNRPLKGYVQNPDDMRWLDNFGDVDLGTYIKSLGEDERGKYVSYYDKWDIEPWDFGTPFELYDRIYYTIDANGNAVQVIPQ